MRLRLRFRNVQNVCDHANLLPYTVDPSTKAVRVLSCCLMLRWHTGMDRTKLRQVAVRFTHE